MDKPIYIIDGDRFSDLEGFYDEVEQHLIPDTFWGRNLDAFNDILRGGVGLPRTFILVWKNIDKSQARLGHEQTGKRFQDKKQEFIENSLQNERKSHPESQNLSDEILLEKLAKQYQEYFTYMDDNISLARQKQGRTLFDQIIEIIAENKNVEFRTE